MYAIYFYIHTWLQISGHDQVIPDLFGLYFKLWKVTSLQLHHHRWSIVHPTCKKYASHRSLSLSKIYIYTYVCTSVYTVYIYIYSHMYIYIYMNIRIYIYIRIIVNITYRSTYIFIFYIRLHQLSMHVEPRLRQ